MMSKRRIIRFTQKILILVMSAVAGILLLLMLQAPSLDIFLFKNARFTIPKIPVIKVGNDQLSAALPECFVLKLASHDLILLKSLRQQGWPAYIAEDKIQIGPYLKSFQSQLDITKISQITSIPVKIVNLHFL